MEMCFFSSSLFCSLYLLPYSYNLVFQYQYSFIADELGQLLNQFILTLLAQDTVAIHHQA